MNSHLILPGTYASEEKVESVCAKYDRIESEQELLKKRVEQLGSTLEAVSNQNSRLRRHTKWLAIAVAVLAAILAAVMVQQGQMLGLIEQMSEILTEFSNLI